MIETRLLISYRTWNEPTRIEKCSTRFEAFEIESFDVRRLGSCASDHEAEATDDEDID